MRKYHFFLHPKKNPISNNPIPWNFFIFLFLYCVVFLNSQNTCSAKNWLNKFFSKFYGKVGVISWLLFHLIWRTYVLYWHFDLKSWIVDFFTRFTREKTPQYNFSSQNFCVENNYSFGSFTIRRVLLLESNSTGWQTQS